MENAAKQPRPKDNESVAQVATDATSQDAVPPAQVFEEGFTAKTVVGAIFIALFMLPGGIYLGLVAGQGVGDAAEWVTIVLFAEVARRSFQPLRRQEIYILFYMAASLTAVVSAERGLGGGPFSNLIWNAYFSTSESGQALAHNIPQWAVPTPASDAIMHRELWNSAWWLPIALLALTDLCGRLAWMGIGYALFRITSDVEKLPFPYAPVAASGATALAEAGTESWRWSIFSTGAIVGMLFGLVYVALPVVTSILLGGGGVQILPIPFADYTTNLENVLPAAVVGLSFSLGNVLMGFVLPFEIVAGAAIASILAMVLVNPILYNLGLLPHYRFGSNAFITKLTVDMDFWLSVGIGVNLAVGVLGVALVIRALRHARQARIERTYSLSPPVGRGDVPVYAAILVWLAATMTLIIVCRILVPDFPVWILAFFGLIWSPLNSYVSARMIGLTGRGVSFPYLRETGVVASGYKRVDIWYAPLPIADHGWAAQRFREVELTGTKLTSVLKAEALMFPIVIAASFAFWAFFWNSNPVPSAQFPYAQRFWPVQAQLQAVMMQVNAAGTEGSWFKEALKPDYIAYGTAGGLLVYGLFSLVKLPLLFFYGFAGGLGLFPANTIPQFVGAWFGRRHMARRYGPENWYRYAPVLLAGFSCGTGLVAMVAISFALIAKAIARLPY